MPAQAKVTKALMPHHWHFA